MMIYETPLFRPLGDCYLAVEFGDEADLLLNFRVLALADVLEREAIPGVIEIIPSFRELGIVFDRFETDHAALQETVAALQKTVSDVDQLPSRLVELPVWYDDPWSADLAKRFNVQKNIDFVAEANGITVDEVVRRHTGTDYWVVCVGFTPGCYFSIPLDASKWLKSPKYKIPRSYTPARLIALAGFSTGAYPVASPGGYQVIGRLAVNIYEPNSRSSAFPDDGVLLRAGDRLRYYNVGALEYDDIWNAAQEGTFKYRITDELFDVAGYLASRPGRDA
jgi:KipI family sensor histidine kinase inhibitor